jgi:tRNA A-37 threonylcarbamoyl transferase component Bud32
VALDADGQPDLFAKVATTPDAVDALRREAATLESIRGIARSVRVPDVVAFDDAENCAVLVLSAVRGSRFHNRAPADERHVQLVRELHAVREPVDGAARRNELAVRLSSLPDSPTSRFLRDAVERTASLWEAVRSVHLAHGDLTPWNCLDCGGALGIVDWELSGFRMPGWDVLRYPVQIEAVTRTDPVPAAAERALNAPFVAQAGEEVVHAADVDLPPAERWEALKTLALIESAAELVATQPELSRRGIAIRTHAIARLLGLGPLPLHA